MKRIGILFCIIILSRQVAIAQIKSTIHRENIKTVFVGNVNPQQYIQSQPVIELRQQDAWFLSFDDLSLKSCKYSISDREDIVQSDWHDIIRK